MDRRPIYLRIYAEIQERIRSGAYPPGMCLPSERDFCVEYGASRMTIRQAISALCNDGLLYRIRGKGTFVARQRIQKTLMRVQSFTEDMQQRGFKPGTILLERAVVPAGARLSEIFQVNNDEPIVRIRRLRLADDQPIVIETVYVRHAIGAFALDADLENHSFYDLLRERGVRITRAEQTIEAQPIPAKLADLLEVPHNAAGLVIIRFTYDQHNKRIEYVESVYRGDRYAFYVELKNED